VEGNCNQLAKAAFLTVAHNPGKTTFNPLVVHSGVGLGKTHLNQAIGNCAMREKTVSRVLYVSSEGFINECITSIRTNQQHEFSQKYRNVDILIVDDVQFLRNKETIQEEFYKTFNSLYKRGKQLVLALDRPPSELIGIEERLVSRFHWGLVTYIAPPNHDTRVAIIDQKARDRSMELPLQVCEFIARRYKSNVRELEGAINRLWAFANFQQTEVSLHFAKNVLKNFDSGPQQHLSIQDILMAVAEHFHIPAMDLVGKSRKQEVVNARHIAIYFSKQLTAHSLMSIGQHFGKRDHTTVLHALNCIENKIATSSQARIQINEIRAKIGLS
jgi:chromosomal replication initiator protein